MNLSQKAKKIYTQINMDNTKLGDLRKIAKDTKKDHELSIELWTTGKFFPRQLAILIMDKKLYHAGIYRPNRSRFTES